MWREREEKKRKEKKKRQTHTENKARKSGRRQYQPEAGNCMCQQERGSNCFLCRPDVTSALWVIESQKQGCTLSMVQREPQTTLSESAWLCFNQTFFFLNKK